ncbi:hypothetical protein ACQP25_28630 [Microtetraspora malaysiensis]|uniref:hypothetical protein n=1 Tax=Microtetraspora malaysiensis TaxID=161358 RepID=UPI003D9184E9
MIGRDLVVFPAGVAAAVTIAVSMRAFNNFTIQPERSRRAGSIGGPQSHADLDGRLLR